MRMRRFVVCGLNSSNILLHIFSHTVQSAEKRICLETCALTFYKNSVRCLFGKNPARCCDKRTHSSKCPPFCSMLTKFDFLDRLQHKIPTSNTSLKFHEPPNGRSVAPCGQTDSHNNANSCFSKL
jgi:hypothetical protein